MTKSSLIETRGLHTLWLSAANAKIQTETLPDLFRAGEYVITLGADDYVNGWEECPWPGVQEPSGEEIDMEFDEDGEVTLSMITPTIH